MDPIGAVIMIVFVIIMIAVVAAIFGSNKSTPDPEPNVASEAKFVDLPPVKQEFPGEQSYPFLRFIAWVSLIFGLIGAAWFWSEYSKSDFGLIVSLGLAIEGIVSCVLFLVIASIAENVIVLRKGK